MQQKVNQFQLHHPIKKQTCKEHKDNTADNNDNNNDDDVFSNSAAKNDDDNKTDTSQTSLAGRKRSKSSSLTVNIENISNNDTNVTAASDGGAGNDVNEDTSHDSCKHHTSLLLQLSCIIQLMSVQCPTAFIHVSLTSKGSSRDNIPKPSTPLDKLPMKLNEMPLPKKGMNGVLKKVTVYAYITDI